jgi:hypothetical protein
VCANLTAEDDCDEDVIFEEDDEEFEGYLFAGQGTYMHEDKFQDALIPSLNMSNTLLSKYSTLDDDTKEEVVLNDMDDDSGSIPDVSDPYDAVYANLPEDIHMLEPVENCPHCNAKKFESDPSDSAATAGRLSYPHLIHHPSS